MSKKNSTEIPVLTWSEKSSTPRGAETVGVVGPWRLVVARMGLLRWSAALYIDRNPTMISVPGFGTEFQAKEHAKAGLVAQLRFLGVTFREESR